jgi:hypothetical protein
MTSQLITSYPGGFPNGVAIRNVPLAMAYPGKVYWVSSTNGSNGQKGTFDRPWGTIHYAVGRASVGDIIYVKPGHTETVTAAAGLDIGTAGIAIIALGSGASRPKINFTTATTADMDVDAASVCMMNFLFTGGVDALVAPIDVNASDFSLINCEWRDVTGQAVDVVLADANADRLLIDGLFHNGAAAAGGASAIALIGMDNPTIRNFKIVGNFSVGAIDMRTTAVVDCDIHSGYVWNKNAADIAVVDTITASTGKIGPDLQIMLTDNAANITEAITGATFHLFDPIYVCNLAGEKAMLINTTASTDA